MIFFNDFFTLDFENWLMFNIKNAANLLVKRIRWEIMFMNVVWRLLKGRNLTIFTDQHLSTDDVVMASWY